MIGHLVWNVDRRVHRVELDVELLHVELVLLVLYLCDRVAIVVLRVLVRQVLHSILGFFLFMFLYYKVRERQI